MVGPADNNDFEAEKDRLDQESRIKLQEEQTRLTEEARDNAFGKTAFDQPTDEDGNAQTAEREQNQSSDKLTLDQEQLTQEALRTTAATNAALGQDAEDTSIRDAKKKEEIEQYNHGMAGTGHLAGTIFDGRSLKEEEEQRAKQEAQNRAAMALGLDNEPFDFDVLIDNINKKQEEVAQKLDQLTVQCAEVTAMVSDTLDELDTLIDEVKALEDPDEDAACTSFDYYITLDDYRDVLHEKMSDSIETIEQLNQEKQAILKEQQDLERSVKINGKETPEDIKTAQDIEKRLDNINKDITEAKDQLIDLNDETKVVMAINKDPDLTIEQKARFNEVYGMTLRPSDGKIPDIKHSAEWLDDDTAAMRFNLVKSSLAELDQNDPNVQKYYDLLEKRGLKITSPEGKPLEGREAIEHLRAEVNLDRDTFVVPEKIEEDIEKLASGGNKTISREELDELYEKYGASDAAKENTEALLASDDYKITDSKEPVALASAEGDTPDPISTVAASGTVSGETATGDASGLGEPAPKTSEEEMATMDAVQRQLEGGTITREEIDKIYAETGASDEIIAKIEADKTVKIEEPTQEPTAETGIKGVAANELGDENTNIAFNAGTAAMVSAFPFLAAFRGPTIDPSLDTDNRCNGIDNSCFADSEQFHATDPAGETSYNAPYKNGADAAPGASQDYFAALRNDGTKTSTGSGDSTGTAQDQEAELRMTAERAELARVQMQQLNDLNRRDLDPPDMVG